MSSSASRFENLETLRTYIQQTLCQHDQLEVDAFPFTERLLVRGGRPCGVLFCLHGPRAVKFTAIWEVEHNTVLFYGSSGERFSKIQLAHAPRLAAPS